ncbi:MAG TPA: hypothetical protein VGN34_26035 [Ktedonobacteraceae bacterium]
MYDETRTALAKLNLPKADDLTPGVSAKRFADGAQVRVEIPSCEGPDVLRAVLEEAERLQVPVHRVSQGSGIMLQTDQEIREMVKLGAEAGIEISLFVGPHAGWHLSAFSKAKDGGIAQSRITGAEMMVHAIEDVKRAYGLGIRSVLVSDEGLLWVMNEMRCTGDIGADMHFKVSVSMGVTNPATAYLMERSGANTINVITDLAVPQIAAVRAAISKPIDLYVEVPDDMGGFVRYFEIPELIYYCAPIYIKFGIRNAPNIYPSGGHIVETAIKLGRERVRRARIGLEMIERHTPEVKISATKQRHADLGVPVV